MPGLLTLVPLVVIHQVVQFTGAAPCDATTARPDPCLSPPALGQSMTDAATGRPIVRLSDAAARGVEFVQAEYATQDHLNAADAWAFVEDSHGAVQIVDLRGGIVRDLATEPGLPVVASSSGAVWDPVFPDVLYYTSGNELRRRIVGSPSTDVALVALGGYTSVARTGETDIAPVDPRAPDDRRFVLVGTTPGGTQDVVVVRHDVARGGAVRTGLLSLPPGASLDWAQITTDFVVLGFRNFPGMADPASVRLYDHGMAPLREVARFNGHQDVGVDPEGRQVLYLATADAPEAELARLDGCVNSVAKLDLADGRVTCLARGEPALDWSIALHVAAPSGPSPWVYVSTHGSTLAPPWHPYTNEIVRFRADGGCPAERLAHHHSVMTTGNDYNYQTRASVNRDGTKVLFNSNFGLRDRGGLGCASADLGLSIQYSDVYLLLVD